MKKILSMIMIAAASVSVANVALGMETPKSTRESYTTFLEKAGMLQNHQSFKRYSTDSFNSIIFKQEIKKGSVLNAEAQRIVHTPNTTGYITNGYKIEDHFKETMSASQFTKHWYSIVRTGWLYDYKAIVTAETKNNEKNETAPTVQAQKREWHKKTVAGTALAGVGIGLAAYWYKDSIANRVSFPNISTIFSWVTKK